MNWMWGIGMLVTMVGSFWLSATVRGKDINPLTAMLAGFTIGLGGLLIGMA